MTIVIDANILAALMVQLPYSDRSTLKTQEWKRQGVRMLAPSLCFYEVLTILRKAIVRGLISESELSAALALFGQLSIEFIEPDLQHGLQSLAWSTRLNQSKAYDGAYLALANQYQAEFWTADKRAAHAAAQQGIEWMKLLGMVHKPVDRLTTE